VQSSGTATGLALVGAAVTTTANFGIALGLARAGASLAGVFFAATAVVAILGNTAGLGTMTGLVYHLPTATDGTHPNPRSLVGYAAGPVSAAGALAAVVIVLAADPIAAVLAPGRTADLATMLRLLAVAVPAWALTVTFLGATRGLGSMTPTVVINQVLKPVCQLGGVGGLLFIYGEPSMGALAVAWGWPIVAAAVLAFGALWRAGGLAGGGPAPVSAAEFWRYTRPRSLATGLQIALERIDVILVSALAGEAAAGIYGTVSRFITAGNFVVYSIGQATSPGLRRAISTGRGEEAQRLLHQATGWMVLVAWPYFLFVAVEADSLISLLNPAFTEGATALAILALALLTHAATGPIDLALLMLGRSRPSLGIAATALTADVVLAVALIPRFGAAGAAIGWACAVLIQNGVAALLVHRVGGLRPVGWPAVIAGCGALLAIVPVAVVTPPGTAGLALTTIVAGPIYLLWVTKFAHRLDVANLVPGRRSPSP
jgi:O-antigen/teichoic acid export membrane protein